MLSSPSAATAFAGMQRQEGRHIGHSAPGLTFDSFTPKHQENLITAFIILTTKL